MYEDYYEINNKREKIGAKKLKYYSEIYLRNKKYVWIFYNLRYYIEVSMMI